MYRNYQGPQRYNSSGLSVTPRGPIYGAWAHDPYGRYLLGGFLEDGDTGWVVALVGVGQRRPFSGL